MTDTALPINAKLARDTLIGRSFSPHSPINSAALFRGRIGQIRAATDAITAQGLHVILYGERGVGKTSLAATISELLSGVILATSRVNCGGRDTFTDVIRRSMGQLYFTRSVPSIGFNKEASTEGVSAADWLPDEGKLAPDQVAEILSQLPAFVVLVIDEFDRLSPEAIADFADLIKSLSDRGADATIVLVGVAEDVNDLIGSHVSIERCLRQIPLPRMSEDEIFEILDKALQNAGFEIQPEARSHIARVSQGFPMYAHLLGMNSARAALDQESDLITDAHVINGMQLAVLHSDQTHRDAYFKAVTGTKKANLWKPVVAACAQAESDERGYFSSRSVLDSLSRVLGRPVIQQTVAFHLGRLIEPSRGPLLERIGPERRYRYRFSNPLMRPFVLMKIAAEGEAADPG